MTDTPLATDPTYRYETRRAVDDELCYARGLHWTLARDWMDSYRVRQLREKLLDEAVTYGTEVA